MQINKIKIIESCSEAGAGTRGASLGAGALQLASLKLMPQLFNPFDKIKVKNLNQEICKTNNLPNAKNAEQVLFAAQQLAGTTESGLKAGNDLLILTGDHSNAAGSVSGFSNHFGAENIGVVWIDAHADLHSPYTTPSGNMHGMPLAAMLGKDNLKEQAQSPKGETLKIWESLKTMGSKKDQPKLFAKNLVFIGIRDLEQQEWDFIEEYGIKYFSPQKIEAMGIEAVCKEAQAYLAGLAHWYISFDVDSIDPNISSGTGTPVPLGLSKTEVLHCFKTFFKHPKVQAFEITEINPLLDTENKMAEFVLENLGEVLR